MNKTVFAMLLTVLGSGGCGTIYVGNVPFSSKEICSAEYADWYHPNSSCLPPARAANVQSYFMEKKRLPISGDEARQVDRAALTEDAAYTLSTIRKVVNVSNALMTSITRLGNSIEDSKKAIDEAQKDGGVADSAEKLRALLSSFDDTKIPSSKIELDGLAGDLKRVGLSPDGFAKIREALKAAKKIADKSDAAAVDVIKDALEQFKQNTIALQASIDGLIKTKGALSSWKEPGGYKVPGIISGLDEKLGELREDKSKLEAKLASSKSGDPDKKSLETQLRKLDTVIVRVDAVRINAKATTGYLIDSQTKLVDAKKSIDDTVARLQGMQQQAGNVSLVLLLDQAMAVATELQFGILESSVVPNLLPSLIGRVFVADVNHSSTVADGEYLVPGNAGNLEFMPVTNWNAVENIETEIQVNSDISGIVRKQVGISGNFNATQLLEKVASTHITPQLQAVMGVSLASLDTGSGSYYYVTMTAKQLDELNGKLWEYKCKAAVPPGRGDSMLKAESPYPVDQQYSHEGCAPALLADRLGFIADSSIKDAPGLGIIVGAAILRTRKGASEVCSTMEITLSPDRSKLDTGKAGTVCSELRSILEGSEVPQAEISTALAAVNAAYRSETYKTMLIHDHASVLAIHWVPVKLISPPANK